MEGITVKCPECGHKMTIDPKVIAFRCSKCGKKIDLDEEPVRDEPLKWPGFGAFNTAHTERQVNDADVIRARTEYEKQQAELSKQQAELEEQKKFNQHPFKESMKILFTICAYIFGFGLFAILMIKVIPDLIFRY